MKSILKYNYSLSGKFSGGGGVKSRPDDPRQNKSFGLAFGQARRQAIQAKG